MKIKIFRKIFILIVLFLAFSINNSFAENRSIDNIKREIQILKKDFENTEDLSIKKNINDKVEKLLNKIENKNLKRYNFSTRSLNNDNCSSWVKNLKTRDVILFRYTEKDILHHIFGTYKHAAVIYEPGVLFDIGTYSEKYSGKTNLREVIKDCKKGKYEQIVVLKMGFNFFQEINFKQYIDTYLIGKEYSSTPISNKYTRFTFYCSLLVWNAHKNSGKYVDMDYDGGVYVWPVDLLYSNESISNNYFYF